METPSIAQNKFSGATLVAYLHETFAEILGFDVEDLGLEDGSRVVDLLNDQTVCERRDVQHVKKSGSRSIDTLTLLDHVDGRLLKK